MQNKTSYLMSGALSELERLQLQSRVWEPAGEALLATLGSGEEKHTVDVGCGALGWLRILSAWTGDEGRVVGTDIDERLLSAARQSTHDLGNVELIADDLFDSKLPAATFDLVHARFELAPLGRFHEQIAEYVRLAKPGGTIVIEEPDASSWHFNPSATACEELIELIVAAFAAVGGDFNVGRRLPELLGRFAGVVDVQARVVALQAPHPYLRLPLQFAQSLESRLLQLVDATKLKSLRERAEEELADSARWGTTFTLIQTMATRR